MEPILSPAMGNGNTTEPVAPRSLAASALATIDDWLAALALEGDARRGAILQALEIVASVLIGREIELSGIDRVWNAIAIRIRSRARLATEAEDERRATLQAGTQAAPRRSRPER